MAEGFEQYHIPQQSRREKLRILALNQQPNYVDSSSNTTTTTHINHLHQGFPSSSYDPSSLISSDLLTSAPNFQHHQNYSNFLGGGGGGGHIDQGIKTNPHIIKEENMSLMTMFGAQQNTNNSYMESPHLGIIPATSVRDHNHHQSSSSYLYGLPSQNVRQLDQTFHEGRGGEIMLYRPEAAALSLSLSSQQNHHQPELNLQKYMVPASTTVGDLSCRSSVPLGPFTGYATVLKNSRFLKPAQQLLEDVCDVSSRICFAADKMVGPDDSASFGPDTMSGGGAAAEIGDSSTDDSSVGGEYKKFKSGLISMLDEVYRRYKQYYQQLEAVIASFESVAGLSNAAPFVNLAIKAMSKQFRRLKKAIIDQLQFLGKAPSNTSSRKDGIYVSESGSRPRPGGQRPIHNSGHHPVWRPQRGLPERAVSVLRSWLFEHFLHPYPTDTDKMMLAKQTGLTRGQVSNWFINARVRLWKPMVEEIHALETTQGHKASRRQDKEAADQPNDLVACASSLTSDKLPISCTKTQDPPFKRIRNELPDLPLASDQQMNLYNNMSGHPCMGVGTAGGGSSSVSLTLGLHQNNGIGLPSETFPMNLSHRYGFNANSEGCVIGGFDGQPRHLSTRDVMGGYLLHDFVG